MCRCWRRAPLGRSGGLYRKPNTAKSASPVIVTGLALSLLGPAANADDGQLGRFFEELGSEQALVEGGLWGLGALAAWPADEAISDWMRDTEPLGPNATEIGYWMGHRYTVAGSIAAFAAVGWLTDNDEPVETAQLLLEAQLVSGGVTQLLKYGVRRERPDDSNLFSFPSGHATGAWCSALLIQGRYGWGWGAPAMLAALYIGGSRIQGGRHFPSDVLMGFAVGHWASRAALRSVEEDPGDASGSTAAALRFGSTAIPLLHLRF